MPRGRLRVYLGAAPGVGKTFAMLDEGRRRVGRGTDVAIGFVEDHGRPLTRQKIVGLEVVPRQTVNHRGVQFTEMDLAAVLARQPEVALVDELAHTNVPGAGNNKRWQDIEELLTAGIDVITTVNIQHLESLNDVVESITGVGQRETVPDAVVRRADQIELVDMSPEALRRRMAHGNVYPAERIDAALTNYFRLGNLSALRELALLWVADRVDEGLDRYRKDHDIDATWPTRDRIVVALTGGAEGDALIRRGARIAGRRAGRDLLAVHVVRGDGLTDADSQALERQRVLVESLGGTYHSVVGDDVSGALLEFARGVNSSHLLIGASRRGRLSSLLQPWTGEAIVRAAGDIDVHVVTHESSASRTHRPQQRALPPGRLGTGWALALAAPSVLTVLLRAFGEDLGLTTDLLLFLALTVGIALVGGLWPAVAGAVVSSLLLNYYFTPPVHTWTISEPENALALAVFVVIAIAVSLVVDRSARLAQEANRAAADAQLLSTLAGDVVRAPTGVEALLHRLQESFGLDAVSLIERESTQSRWHLAASTGSEPPDDPHEADTTVTIDDLHLLLCRGRPLGASDTRVLQAFAAHTVALLDRDRLRGEADRAELLAQTDNLRTAILTAVSHDVRTPLSAIKAGISSLRQRDVSWNPSEQEELMATVEEGADQLDSLLSNLLDLSRIQAGIVTARCDEVSVADVVARATSTAELSSVSIELPDDLPAVIADAGLLERVLANVIENAVRLSPPANPVRVMAHSSNGVVRVSIVDRGPGVSRPQRDRMFEPFQRLGDAPQGEGLGLGLAVARGLTSAQKGSLEVEDTPGGGLTLVLTLPAARGGESTKAQPS